MLQSDRFISGCHAIGIVETTFQDNCFGNPVADQPQAFQQITNPLEVTMWLHGEQYSFMF